MHPSNVLLHDRNPFGADARPAPQHAAGMEDPDEESEEKSLLEEAAAALGADPQHADLVARIKDCIAEHAGGGESEPGESMPMPPKPAPAY